MAGVARSRLDDGATRLQQAALFGILDHPEPDPFLSATARIQGLDLGQDRRAEPGGDSMEPHQRRVPDGLQDAAQDLHGPHHTVGLTPVLVWWLISVDRGVQREPGRAAIRRPNDEAWVVLHRPDGDEAGGLIDEVELAGEEVVELSGAQTPAPATIERGKE